MFKNKIHWLFKYVSTLKCKQNSYKAWGPRLDLPLQGNAVKVSLNLKPQLIGSYVEFLNANNLAGTQKYYYIGRTIEPDFHQKPELKKHGKI